MTPQEATAIRAQLRLRENVMTGELEVYTTIHGTGIFKWYKVSRDIADWYYKRFRLTWEYWNRPDIDTGHINEATPK